MSKKKMFDPLEPFLGKKLLKELLDKLEQFKYKLYGKIPLKFYKGKPTKYEFDLNFGMMHVTEQDCKGLSEIFSEVNKKWNTQMTYCIYPGKEGKREMIMNVRGSPKAPANLE